MQYKAGRYYIGDASNILNEEHWTEFVNDVNKGNSGNSTYRGKPIYVTAETYGEGIYSDNEGREYDVESGVICVMPEELIDIEEYKEKTIEFKKDFNIKIKNGELLIGKLSIKVSESDEEKNVLDEIFGNID